MGSLERLRLLVTRKPSELPTEVFAALIDELYSPVMSLVIAGVSASLLGGMAAWRTGNSWLAILSAIAAVVQGARITVALAFRSRQAGIGEDATALRHWETRHATGAFIFAACIGGICFVTLAFTDDPISHLLVGVGAVGYSAGVTARNSSRSWIAVTQLCLVLMPITVGSAFRLEPAYALMAAIVLMHNVSTVEIADHLGRHRLRLLLALREKDALVNSLAAQNLRFDAALSNMAQGLCVFDRELRLVISNSRFAEIFRIAPDQFAPGAPIDEIMAIAQTRDKNSERAADLQQRLLAEWPTAPIVTTLADERIISITHRPMPDGGLVATFDDITEQRRAEDRIAYLARHDPLTDLANRLFFYERLNNCLDDKDDSQSLAVLSLDLDRFKSVNDKLGHPFGDKLLQAMAKRVRGCIHDRDLVARLGGDEFAVVRIPLGRIADAGELASRLIDSIGAPYDIDGQQVLVGASVGIAVAPNDGTKADVLMKNADLALYRAKSDGGATYRYFEAEMDARMQERRALELDLRKAIANGEFELYYQPIIDVHTGQINSCEALVRWHHPEQGIISPVKFIPIAEETGLIVPLGDWVLRRACEQAMRWPKHVTIAVNVSPAQFKSRNFVQTVVSALAASGIAANRLSLEITELALLEENQKSLDILGKLHDFGIRIVMDDFGTGYSSLGYLRSFPFDKIKIDQSFIRDLTTKDDSVAIVRAVVGLSSSLGITTTAEGVETKEQLARLAAEGCNEAQGYLFSPPRPAAEIQHLLDAANERLVDVA